MASKNSASKPKKILLYKSQNAGLWAEAVVIHKMQQANWELVFQRAKTTIAEIDLIFEKENKIALIEVKKLNNSWRAFERISEKQVSRLRLNQGYIQRFFPNYKIIAAICWVSNKGTTSFSMLE